MKLRVKQAVLRSKWWTGRENDLLGRFGPSLNLQPRQACVAPLWKTPLSEKRNLESCLCTWDLDYYYGPKNILISFHTRKVSRLAFGDVFNEKGHCDDDRLQEDAVEIWNVRHPLYEEQEDVAADSVLGAAEEEKDGDLAIEAGKRLSTLPL
eukprot:gene39192-47686_t